MHRSDYWGLMCLVCFNVAIAVDVVWKLQRTTDETAANLSKLWNITLPSIITCVGTCRQLGVDSCAGVQVIPNNTCDLPTCPIQCVILSDSLLLGDRLDTTIDSLIYLSSLCSYSFDPCQPNPCYGNSSVCRVVVQSPECYQNHFECICEGQRAGPTCHICKANFTGPNCETDISDSVLVDGTYFYIPYGINVDGKDTDHVMRPNCSVSRQLCEQRGMRLLTIKTQQKNVTVSKLLLHNSSCVFCFYQLNLQLSSSSGNDGTQRWWWGDDQQDVLADGDFQGWYYGQPDGAIGENYVAFSPTNGYSWSDVSCTFPAYYICEYEPPQ